MAALALPLASDTSPCASIPAADPSPSFETPRKRRRVSNESILPPLVSSKSLPEFVDLQPGTLLSLQARQLLSTGRYHSRAVRTRLRGKTPLDDHAVLDAIMRDPAKELVPEPLTWQTRRDARFRLARMFASQYGVSVRAGVRKMVQLAAEVSDEVLRNALLLSSRFEPEKVERDGTDDQPSEVQYAIGGLFTWHTMIGRRRDNVKELLDKGLRTLEIGELLQTDPEMQKHFADFCKFIDDMCQRVGFDIWSASMEMNSDSASKAVVHLHAYCCRHWKNWKRKSLDTRSVVREHWKFGGMVPHFNPANVRNNMNPQRPLSQGIYYELCPKIGSVFKHSPLTPFVD